MNSFKPIDKLNVHRRLSTGIVINVGQLAQNKSSVYFQYDENYLKNNYNLSPFNLKFTHDLLKAPSTPHSGLHGVFADSLPDGWGLLLMDRVFRQHNIQPSQLTALDRLSYMGNNCMGALSYSPVSDFSPTPATKNINLQELGQSAVSLFEGNIDEILPELINIGSPGGARPKAQLFINNNDTSLVSTYQQLNYQPWLVKFTSSSLLLGHDEGLCEAAYLSMAKNCGIIVPDWKIMSLKSNKQAINWLAMRRYDCHQNFTKKNLGRYHTHSMCGLLDADFRQPSLDYEDIIRASQVLCKSPEIGKEFFKRAIFNLFTLNQDDHSKNWEFIQDDNGSWRTAPFFDITFSPTPYNEHSTAFVGYGKSPSLKAIQKLASLANFKNWEQAKIIVQNIIDEINNWDTIAQDLNISLSNRKMISKQLKQIQQDNRHLYT